MNRGSVASSEISLSAAIGRGNGQQQKRTRRHNEGRAEELRPAPQHHAFNESVRTIRAHPRQRPSEPPIPAVAHQSSQEEIRQRLAHAKHHQPIVPYYQQNVTDVANGLVALTGESGANLPRIVGNDEFAAGPCVQEVIQMQNCG